MDDHLRAIYNQRAVSGGLCSVLANSASQETAADDEFLVESFLVYFAQRQQQQQHQQKTSAYTTDPNACASTTRRMLLSETNILQSYYPSTTQDLIDFAVDLNLMAAPSSSSSSSSSSTSTSTAANSASSTASMDLPTTTTSTRGVAGGDGGEAKSINNPFKSAKDQFIKEGGKFQPPAALGGVGGTAAANMITSKVLGVHNKEGAKGSSGDYVLPPELEHLDKTLVEKIEADIVVRGHSVTFGDIAGLEFAKTCVKEMICWPMSRPDLFCGLRALPKGLLLFGPPGTGKTLIGKAIAHEVGATFFSISASSLMSKWIGEGEKTVRTLFAVAVYRNPSVVFLDEVDSLLCQRSSDENEGSRRMKTEFLVQLDGAGTDQDARVVVVGATNRPEELDEAARRRFVKRIYVPLPDSEGRRTLLTTLLRDSSHTLGAEDILYLDHATINFSGAGTFVIFLIIIIIIFIIIIIIIIIFFFWLVTFTNYTNIYPLTRIHTLAHTHATCA